MVSKFKFSIQKIIFSFHFHLQADTKNPQTATESSQSHGVRPLREPHDFEEFLGKCFRKPVLEYTIKSLTKYGDHRGSELQALNVKFSKNNGSTEVLMIEIDQIKSTSNQLK